MTKPVIDVINCDREPIHTPGAIQSHGFMIALDRQSATIKYVSGNVAETTGLKPASVLHRSFEDFLQQSSIEVKPLILSRVFSVVGEVSFDDINPVPVQINNTCYYLIFHAANDNVLLAEFEPCEATAESDLQRLVGISVSRMLESRTTSLLLQSAAESIRNIIGYDRVMIYRFWEDGHGEVMAEDRREGVESFMGLHYPASDIPKQARDLYLTNLTRLIADVNGTTSPLLSIGSSADAPPLDLTHSILRAISPVHIQYLKNMGVAASFSVSVVVQDKLWGLVACHNLTPKFIDYKAREAAKLLGQILSSSLQFRDEEQTKNAMHLYRQAGDELIKQMQTNGNIAEALSQNGHLLLTTTHASGTAVLFEGNIYTTGVVPGKEEIQGIAEWLKQNESSSLFQTCNFSQQYEEAVAFADVASGMLACTISKDLYEYILWFKPERVKTVTWAGNPDKPMEEDADGRQRLSPRHSFAAWRQQVRHTSEDWSKAEIAAALKLREDITYIINEKANALRLLNEKLREAYDDLDRFSYTISHDLKTPLTSIRSYTEIMLMQRNKLDGDMEMMLSRIVQGTDKMRNLINEVLAYSRIIRQETQHEPVNMEQLVPEIVQELKMAYKENSIGVSIKNLINLSGDKTMMMQVFSNVIGNAIKYSQFVEQPLVTIDSRPDGDAVLYSIADNGIGIDMKHGDKVFEIFKRMDNVKGYEGTGVGLSIVKRIMEKSNGSIWYESELGKGTTFYLSFPKE